MGSLTARLERLETQDAGFTSFRQCPGCGQTVRGDVVNYTGTEPCQHPPDTLLIGRADITIRHPLAMGPRDRR